jgi:hypothetical protein
MLNIQLIINFLIVWHDKYHIITPLIYYHKLF